MEGLSKDDIMHIFSYIYPDQGTSALEMRLINKTFNQAIICFRPIWTDILGSSGPKMIGPKSVHKFKGHPSGCKISEKTQKCYIASHYLPHTLIPRYNSDDPYRAYQTVIKIKKKKFIKHLQAEKRKSERELQKAIDRFKRTRDYLMPQIDELESALKKASR